MCARWFNWRRIAAAFSALVLHSDVAAQVLPGNENPVVGQAALTNSPIVRREVTLTGIAAFSPKKWAFITIRTGTEEKWLRLVEGEEKEGFKLLSVNPELAQARMVINGVEQTISFAAALPGRSREQAAKEDRDREHARVSALRAQQDRERDRQELERYLQTLRHWPGSAEPGNESSDEY